MLELILFIIVSVLLVVSVLVFQPHMTKEERKDRRERNEKGIL